MNERLHLTRDEVRLLMQATVAGRHGTRDYCMIKLGFIHGLRVSELTGLKMTDIDFVSGQIYIRRLKGGFCTIHPLLEAEKKALMNWLAIRDKYCPENSPWVFLTLAGRKITRQQIYKLMRKYGEYAGLSLNIHPHMLRHGCGFELANQGLDTRLIQDYLGHRNIRHTVHYTAGNAARFAAAWKDNPYIVFKG